MTLSSTALTCTGLFFCIVDHQRFAEQIAACEGVHRDLIELFILKGAFELSFQEQTGAVQNTAQSDDIFVLLYLLHPSVQYFDRFR